jgi:hypothetical protein
MAFGWIVLTTVVRLRGEERSEQVLALGGSASVPRTPVHGRQMPANAASGRVLQHPTQQVS